LVYCGKKGEGNSGKRERCRRAGILQSKKEGNSREKEGKPTPKESEKGLRSKALNREKGRGPEKSWKEGRSQKGHVPFMRTGKVGPFETTKKDQMT